VSQPLEKWSSYIEDYFSGWGGGQLLSSLVLWCVVLVLLGLSMLTHSLYDKIVEKRGPISLSGTDKLTIFLPKNEYLVRCITQNSIGVGATIEIWSDTR
jgi:hypothetical protein